MEPFSIIKNTNEFIYILFFVFKNVMFTIQPDQRGGVCKPHFGVQKNCVFLTLHQ